MNEILIPLNQKTSGPPKYLPTIDDKNYSKKLSIEFHKKAFERVRPALIVGKPKPEQSFEGDRFNNTQ